MPVACGDASAIPSDCQVVSPGSSSPMVLDDSEESLPDWLDDVDDPELAEDADDADEADETELLEADEAELLSELSLLAEEADDSLL